MGQMRGKTEYHHCSCKAFGGGRNKELFICQSRGNIDTGEEV